MKKNLIFLVTDNTDCKPIFESWEYWCNKNNCDFTYGTNLNKIDVRYDKVGIIKPETIIKWDTPNIFDSFNDDQYCGVVDNIDLKAIYEDINLCKNIFPKLKVDISYYLSGDVLFLGRQYLEVFDRIKNTPFKETMLNHYLQENIDKMVELRPNWNLLGIKIRDFFSYNWQLKEDNTPFFIKYGNIWNFKEFDNEKNKLMDELWKNIKGFYK